MQSRKPNRDFFVEREESQRFLGENEEEPVENCGICTEKVTEVVENDRFKQQTNYSYPVNCDCKRPTLHMECLYQSFEYSAKRGIMKMDCPLCRKTCAKIQSKPYELLKKTAKVLMYTSILNVLSKAFVGLTFEVMFVAFVVSNFFENGIASRFFRSRIAKKAAITLTIVATNRIIRYMLLIFTQWLFKTCEFMDSSVPKERQNIALDRWMFVHHNLQQDLSFQSGNNVFVCSSTILIHHLLFEYQTKLVIYALIHVALVVLRKFYRGGKIKILKK